MVFLQSAPKGSAQPISLEAKAARISGLKGGSPPEFLAARSGPQYCPGSRIEIRRTPLLYYTWRACDGLHRCRWP